MRVTAKYQAVYTLKRGTNRRQKQQPSGEVDWGVDSSRGKPKLLSKLRRASEEGCLGNGSSSLLSQAAGAQPLAATRHSALGTDRHAQWQAL